MAGEVEAEHGPSLEDRIARLEIIERLHDDQERGMVGLLDRLNTRVSELEARQEALNGR